MHELASSGTAAGRDIAALLFRSWASQPPELMVPVERLEAIATTLAQGFSAPLAWHRLVSSTGPESATAFRELRRAHAFSRMCQPLREQAVARSITHLGTRGIEPILVKGWSIARSYPDSSLRPYEDIDLYLPRDRFWDAQQHLLEFDSGFGHIDLQRDPGLFEDLGGWERVLERSQLVDCGGTQVRVPAPEHQLRFVCIHLARHAAQRPIWLCDVAVLLEAFGPTLDWNECLAGLRFRAAWCRAVLRLAVDLLGANPAGTPVESLPDPPAWLKRAVLREWERPFRLMNNRMPIAELLFSNPAQALSEIPRRWPSPIDSTYSARGDPFSRMPRLPFEVLDLVRTRLPIVASGVRSALVLRRGETATTGSPADFDEDP